MSEIGIIVESLVSALGASLVYSGARRAKNSDAKFDVGRTGITLVAAFVVSVVLIWLPERALSAGSLQKYMAFVGPIAVYLERLFDEFRTTPDDVDDLFEGLLSFGLESKSESESSANTSDGDGEGNSNSTYADTVLHPGSGSE